MVGQANFSMEVDVATGAMNARFRPNPVDYQAAANVVVKLGVAQANIPAFTDVAGSITTAQQTFLDAQVARGDVPEFSFDIPLTGTKPLSSLIAGYNLLALTHGGMVGVMPVLPDNNEWQLQSPRDAPKAVTPSLVLQDASDPRNRTVVSNQFGPGIAHIDWCDGQTSPEEWDGEEAQIEQLNQARRIVSGLVYTNMNAAGQRSAVATERADCRRVGVSLSPISLPELLVREGKMIVEPDDYTDRNEGQSIVNMVQYRDFPDWQTGQLRVPCVHTVRPDMLAITFGQPVNIEHPYIGVRRVVRLVLDNA